MEVAENACRVVAIELLCAAQALSFGVRPGRGVEVAHELIRAMWSRWRKTAAEPGYGERQSLCPRVGSGGEEEVDAGTD